MSQASALYYTMTLCVVTACAGGGQASRWENIDYTPVYRAYEKRQNDAGYTAPSVVGCVDDDLYNCR
jgi:hypothetical protein